MKVLLDDLIENHTNFKKCVFCGSPNLTQNENCCTCDSEEFEDWEKEDGMELKSIIGENIRYEV